MVIVLDSVKWIGRRAFAKCENLTKIILPDNIELPDDVFDGCNRLEKTGIIFSSEINKEKFSSFKQNDRIYPFL